MGTFELLTLYAQPAQSVRERHIGAGRHLWRGALRVFGWALILTSICLAAWRIWQGWQTNEWRYAPGAIVLIVSAYILSLWLPGRDPTSTSAERTALDILRKAVTDTHGAHAPLAATQPEALSSDELPVSPEALKPPWLLGHIARSSPPGLWGLVAAIVPFAIDQLGAVLPRGFPLPSFAVSSTIFGFAFFALLIVFMLMARSANPTIMVDEIGIRWREGKHERALDWARATAFFTATFVLSKIPITTYVLDSPDGALAWGIPQVGSLQPRIPEGEALARLVAARTRLPLRDASEWVEELGGPAPDLPALASEVGLTGVPPNLAPQRASLPRRIGCLAQLAVLMALIVAGLGLRLYQNPFYFSSLPARLHAETPLFADALSAPTGAWPIETPTASDTSSAQYVDGTYWLRGDPGQTQWALSPSTYGDVAVAVTARELAATGSSDVQGVGLALRASAGASDAVFFLVTPDGHAHLWQYHAQSPDDSDRAWGQLAEQRDPAIHTGVGAANRLLVIMRGGLYLCYVNDTLVITYYDQGHNVTSPPTPHTGQAGVYVNDGAVGGAFSDFAVYPVQPPSSFWYV